VVINYIEYFLSRYPSFVASSATDRPSGFAVHLRLVVTTMSCTSCICVVGCYMHVVMIISCSRLSLIHLFVSVVPDIQSMIDS